LNQAVKNALADEAVKARLLNAGSQPASSTSQSLYDLLKKDTEKWARVIKEKNIKPD
jgi:tripartite-type tricarboxylate transporter receptor subunit TctC